MKAGQSYRAWNRERMRRLRYAAKRAKDGTVRILGIRVRVKLCGS